VGLAYLLIYSVSHSPYMSFYNLKVTLGMWAVSYTHLDVYKRQGLPH